MFQLPDNPLSSRINKDRVMMVSRMSGAAAAGVVFDALRNERPEDLIVGIATAFAMVSERVDGGPEELYHVGRKVLRQEPHEDKANAMTESLRDLGNKTLRHKETT